MNKSNSLKAIIYLVLTLITILFMVLITRTRISEERTVLLAERDMITENLRQKTVKYCEALLSPSDNNDLTSAHEKYSIALDMAEQWNIHWNYLCQRKQSIWGFLYADEYGYGKNISIHETEELVLSARTEAEKKMIEKLEEATKVTYDELEVLNEYIDELMQEKINTYTIYLDGARVDNDKVYIYLYNYYIDDEKQVIYLTHKAKEQRRK